MKTWDGLLVPALLVGLAACSAQRHDMAQGGTAAADRPVLYDGLGSYSSRITTSSPEAQRWFDQGLRLVYAFNHHEAERAFVEAARLDPACALCFWGMAITEGSCRRRCGSRPPRALASAR